jgi:VIT1/CCC1 family predicted Fe2+/Mn2+ transporter
MKRFVLTLTVLFISIFTAVTGQSSDPSPAYKAGYTVGYYLGMISPFLVLAIAGYLIYKFVKRKKPAA